MSDTKETQNNQRTALKNKLLSISCLLFIMFALFMVCYLFFFRTITIDVTKNMDVVYTGESGAASVEVHNMNKNVNQRIQEFLDTITYQVTPRSNLSNGSQITVSASYSQQLADKYNIEVIHTEKEITVEGLAARYDSIDQIAEAYLKTLSGESQNYLDLNMNMILRDDFTNLDDDPIPVLKETTPLYRLFLQSIDGANQDKIIDIYKIAATGKRDGVEQEDAIYYLITYDNVNTSQTINKEKVYGERLLTNADLSEMDALEAALFNKYNLSYSFTIFK